MDMQSTYNQYNLEPTFKKYLFAENINPASIKHYLSDVRHFLGWMGFEMAKNKDSHSFVGIDIYKNITSELIDAYKSYLIKGNTPNKTANRRLSTVRKLCLFLYDQRILNENPASSLTNIYETEVKEPNVNLDNCLAAYKSYLDSFIDTKKNEYLITDIEELFKVIRSQV